MASVTRRIIPEWSGHVNPSQGNAPSPAPTVAFTETKPVPETDRCYSKQELARFLGLSVRSLDRANAAGLLPAPDLVVGRSPRWSPETVRKWLKSRPRLPGRKGGRP